LLPVLLVLTRSALARSQAREREFGQAKGEQERENKAVAARLAAMQAEHQQVRGFAFVIDACWLSVLRASGLDPPVVCRPLRLYEVDDLLTLDWAPSSLRNAVVHRVAPTGI
jgi:hypothetical protein